MSTIDVRPSSDIALWHQATTGGDDALLRHLVATEPPGVAHFHLMVEINGLYRMTQRTGLPAAAVRDRIERVLPLLDQVRAGLDALQQRDLDLGLLRWVRGAGTLTAVVGAGVSMDAGGPSWAGLVRHLLAALPARGHDRPEARDLIAAIDAGTADTDALQRGAQLGLDCLGQHLFSELNAVLYGPPEGPARTPGPIHRAIAELSQPVWVHDRPPHRFPGWASIVTYNFDDLQGEAIDALGLPRAAWAMRGDELRGDPNAAARDAGQGAVYQRIDHLHGYTPRRLFLITQVRFVLAASQYAAHYAQPEQHIVGQVFRDYLANPVLYALYVGCSFSDTAMNDLLRQAADALPGRQHHALLKWPGAGALAEADTAALDAAAAPYLAFGVRPIWFERFEEVPTLIQRLA